MSTEADLVVTEPDPVEWVRRHWADVGQAKPDMFAVMAALLRCHQMVVSSLETELARADIGLNGYLLLTTLLMSRDETRPLGQLSKHLMIHPTTVTLLTDQLEKRGLVKRLPHPSDRRIVLAKLRPAGRRATVNVSRALAAVDFGFGALDTGEARALTETLRRVRAQLGDPT
jgi:DNA-binding MarR family transcriptional regulator